MFFINFLSAQLLQELYKIDLNAQNFQKPTNPRRYEKGRNFNTF